LCARSPPRREAADVENFWVGSLRAPPQLVVAQFFKNPDLDFVHDACKWSCGKKNFVPCLQPTSRLFKSPRNSWNQPATGAIGSPPLISSHENSGNFLCARSPPRRETGDVGNFWVGSLRAPPQLVVAQFFQNPDLGTAVAEQVVEVSCPVVEVSCPVVEVSCPGGP
jgi:hypothetical protein